GYMAVDTGQPGLAQRYYIQALRLAQAAGDRGYGGYVLAASMSHLAAQLGNPREIAQLARAAQEGARGRVTPRAEAMFHAAKARRRAIGYVLLATAQVQQREIEQACNTGLKAVELLETLRSNRGAEYLEDFQQRLEPYREEPVVREFGARMELQAAA